MKKLIIIALLATVAGCSSKAPQLTREQKADTLIKHYLDSTLNDPKSYEPLTFGKIDTVWSGVSADPAYKNLPPGDSDVSADDAIHNPELYLKRSGSGFYENLNEVRKKAQDSLEKVYKPKVLYLKINHEFRAKNGFNAVIKREMVFGVDTSISKIVSAEGKEQ